MVAVDDYIPESMKDTIKKGEYRFFIAESETKNALDYDMDAVMNNTQLPVPPSVTVENMMLEE